MIQWRDNSLFVTASHFQWKGHLDVVKYLDEKRMDSLICDNDGDTPLYNPLGYREDWGWQT